MAPIVELPTGLDTLIIRLRMLLCFKGIWDPDEISGIFSTDDHEHQIVRGLCRDLSALPALLGKNAGPLSLDVLAGRCRNTRDGREVAPSL
jgi:hypothetical protein